MNLADAFPLRYYFCLLPLLELGERSSGWLFGGIGTRQYR
jgi:hypothetical protein